MRQHDTPPVPFDPYLPQLSELLRPQFMGRELGEGNWRVAYLRYKPSTNCIILYENDSAEGSARWTYAKAFAADRPERPPDPHRLYSYDRRRRVAWVRFPHDLRLPSIQKAYLPAAGSQLFKRVIDRPLRQDFSAAWGVWTTVRYKPERRCVLQGHFQPSQAPSPKPFYARFYRDRDIRCLARQRAHLAQCCASQIATPRLLGRSRKRGVLILRGLQGKPLADYLRPGHDTLEAIRLTARALADWHRLPPPTGLTSGRHLAELQALTAYLSRLGQDSDGIQANLDEHMSEMEATWNAGRQVLLHGDFYHDQVLIQPGGRVALVDLDNLRLGDAEEDVANFCSHLLYLSLTGALLPDQGPLLAGEFRRQYQEEAGCSLDPARFSWHLSASLLRLAPRPLRYFLPQWPQLMRRTLTLTFKALEREPC